MAAAEEGNVNEQDKAAMKKATVRTAQEEALFSNERSAFRMGFTAAIEYRDSLVCRPRKARLADGYWNCTGRFFRSDEIPRYCEDCGRRVVTK